MSDQIDNQESPAFLEWAITDLGTMLDAVAFQPRVFVILRSLVAITKRQTGEIERLKAEVRRLKDEL